MDKHFFSLLCFMWTGSCKPHKLDDRNHAWHYHQSVPPVEVFHVLLSCSSCFRKRYFLVWIQICKTIIKNALSPHSLPVPADLLISGCSACRIKQFERLNHSFLPLHSSLFCPGNIFWSYLIVWASHCEKYWMSHIANRLKQKKENIFSLSGLLVFSLEIISGQRLVLERKISLRLNAVCRKVMEKCLKAPKNRWMVALWEYN